MGARRRANFHWPIPRALRDLLANRIRDERREIAPLDHPRPQRHWPKEGRLTCGVQKLPARTKYSRFKKKAAARRTNAAKRPIAVNPDLTALTL